MSWGIIDTVDDCWMGDDEGPKLFDDHGLARIAAQVLEMRVLGTDLAARYQAKEFRPQPLRLKDDVETRMGTLEALRKIEGQEIAVERPPILVVAPKKDDSK